MDHNELWKILKEMGIADHLICLLRNLYTGQEAKEQTSNNLLVQNRERSTVKAVYCHPAYLTYKQSCCCSVTQSCLTLCDPLDCSTPSFPVFTISWRLLKFMSIESMMPSNYLILCGPLLLLPLIFPSIRVFSNELALRIRWPK